jgi:formylglycine-generating enzyme required for sulfatase activity
MLGRELGDYRLLKQLGRGSLGTTYLAEHKYTQKHYTLKVLPEELAFDRAFMQRFQEDVARLAALDHPHLVAIHNVSFSEGAYFLVTDCVVDEVGESTNLYRYLRTHEEPLDEKMLLQQLLPLAEALDYAHNLAGEGKPLIHRGIKLSNVLVGRQKEGTAWYFSDFGLSRIIGCGAVLLRACKIVADTLGAPALWAHAAAEETRYPFPPLEIAHLAPLQHSFLDTFTFLAPEQKCIDGIKGISYKADIYAFGMLTYYLLTRSFAEGVFPLPSESRSDLTYAWDTFVRSCLQSDPKQRPEKLASALRAIHQMPASHGVLMDDYTARITVDEQPSPYYSSESSVVHYQAERKEVKQAQPLLTEMVTLTEGRFWRGSMSGSRDEIPCHQVELESFAIDIHPVTNEQFVRFLETVGSEKDSFHRDLIRLRDARIKRSGGKLSIESGYAKHPVVGVTWYGAMAYAKWVGRRLPTEAEWEVAAASNSARHLYPTGDEIEKSQANFFSSDTTAVMSYAPNDLGLYDMAGNVYEWCYDWYGYSYYEVSQQEPHNPTGPLQGNYRVLRGGCWKSLQEDLRCAKRHRNNPGAVNSTYGFRCAADVSG